MQFDARSLLILATPIVALALIVWTALGTSLPPADFTFSNGTEVKSFDPAIVTGQPEGRILNCLFERLVNWHPKTLEPIPGVAKDWEISSDGKNYTFFLREDAEWSDGSPVTAEDFEYSIRRFLDPRTASEYAMLAWHIKNGRRYSQGGGGIKAGDSVEVELNLPEGATNTLRGEILHGTLVSIENEDNLEERKFLVKIAGKEILFDPIDDVEATETEPEPGTRWCRQVLLDFNEVGVKVDPKKPYELKLTLENSAPYFLQLIGFYPFSPVNRKCVETYGTPGWTKDKNIVCNGPYMVEFRRIRDRTRMVKNPHYWNRDEVRIEVVDALAVDSINTALNLFMTDKVDWINTVPPAALRILLEEDPPRDDLNPSPYLSCYFYMVNTTRKPLDDLRVRRALSLALDREEIAQDILAAGEVPAYSLVPPGIQGYQSQECEKQNIEEAQRLLAEAGFPDGKGFPRIDILYNTEESHKIIAELIRSQWKKNLGIQVKTRNEEWQSYNSSQRQMKYNLCRRGWIGDYVDPYTFLELYESGGEQNNTGFSNSEYDRLLKESAKEQDAAKRLVLLQRAERILMDELPIIPLYYYVSKNMVKPHVRGFYNNLQDMHPVSAMWIDRESDGPNEFMGKKP